MVCPQRNVLAFCFLLTLIFCRSTAALAETASPAQVGILLSENLLRRTTFERYGKQGLHYSEAAAAPSGMWCQLVDVPESWEESSGTAMFAYAMQVGIRHGWLRNYPESHQSAPASRCKAGPKRDNPERRQTHEDEAKHL